MTLTEKKQKLASLVVDGRSYLDKGDMEAYNKVDADIDKLNAEIKAEEKQIERENAMKKVDAAMSKPAPRDSANPKKITETAEYKNAFYKAIREGKSALTAEEKKMFQNVMSVGTDSKGGFLVVPAEMETAIRDILMANVAMRRLATVITSTAEHKVPFVSSYGAASWIGENGAYPKVDDAFEVKSLGSNKLGKIVLVSEELVNDIDYNLTAHINKSFARAFGEAEETAFVSGDGADKPTGVLVDAETGVTTAANNAVVDTELIDLFYSLKVGYRANATFLMNDATEKVLRKLKNATTGDFMWQPGLTAGQPNTLLGRPIASSDSMPTLAATKKIIAFGDFREYMIKDTVGMQMQVLDQLYAQIPLVSNVPNALNNAVFCGGIYNRQSAKDIIVVNILKIVALSRIAFLQDGCEIIALSERSGKRSDNDVNFNA